MSWLDYLRRLYSLDTLDTRFTTSSTVPPRPLASQREDGAKPGNATGKGPKGIGDNASPSRWNTTEFYVYYVVFVTCVFLMFNAAIGVSQESHPNYPKFSHLLSPGWIPGRKVDNSDAQYSTFRENIPHLFLALIIHSLLRRVYVWCTGNGFSSAYSPLVQDGNDRANGPVSPTATAADKRLNQRVSFDFAFALIFICALHGFSAFKIFFILYINYNLAIRLPKQYIPVATWTFNTSILFANELCKGYHFAAVAEFLMPWSATSASGAAEPNWGTWLDSYGGLNPRWEILFNITALRLVSFNLDYYWSLGMRGNAIEKKQLDPSNLSERDRVSSPAKPHDYSFRNYIAYTLYAPLYLAGPILTFNDYISQLRYPAFSITPSRTILYGIRFLVTLITMEVMLHYIYVVAISGSHPEWEVYTPFQLSMLGYFNLHIIWLKLLLPWRFFRFWSLIDGVDPPENMVRCMSNNYSALAFWRGWHRSFNRWIVRYIYIPLGGSGGPNTPGFWGTIRTIANFLAVFTFVALWHDINLRLLMWGWLITLFVLPEVVAGLLFPRRKWSKHREAYRVICGIGAVGNILMMMAANLVGFAVGLDGLKGLVNGIVGSFSGLVFLATACGALFIGTQVMFEAREREMRQGIWLKC
ncbi:MAG: glycerol transporter [Geoglossum simile]|nr:MAG: glycerol transporter [Geoglossum simile]